MKNCHLLKMATSICNICGKCVSRANIARHKRTHGCQVCEKCTHKVETVPPFTDKSLDLWFQAAQLDILCDEIINEMKMLFNTGHYDITEETLLGQYLAAIRHMEYENWLWDKALSTHVFNLVKQRLKSVITNMCG